MSREASLDYWFHQAHELFVAVDNGEVLGAYFLQPEQRGGGSDVANCGYMTAPHAVGRGVARAMCNLVISTNIRAVKLRESFGFETLCRLPGAFLHPTHGYVDAVVMFKALG
jgi:GNAT superfamily N-acetyltransferase